MLSFNETVLKYRYEFNKWELDRNLSGSKCVKSNQAKRRENYKDFLETLNVSPEIIEYSMNEFLPMKRITE